MWQRRTVQSWLKFDRQITKKCDIIPDFICIFFCLQDTSNLYQFSLLMFFALKDTGGKGVCVHFFGKARSQTTLFSYWPPFFSKPSLAPKIVASRPTSNDSRMLRQSVERHRKVRGPCRACSTRTRNCSLQYQVSTEAVPASTKSF